MLVVEEPTVRVAYNAVKMPHDGSITVVVNKRNVTLQFQKGDYLLISGLGQYRIVKPNDFHACYREIKIANSRTPAASDRAQHETTA